MLNREREHQILEILNTAQGFVSVKYLCDTLFASESSIRRDLKRLEENGVLKRSYGGAEILGGFSNVVSFNQRTQQNIKAKREIAKRAAGLVKDGMVVFLDQSSTTFYLAAELLNRNNLTVVTNNIEILMLLSNSKVKLISSGGSVSQDNRKCLVGPEAQRTFENIFADIGFFSVKGLSEDGYITDCSNDEVAVRTYLLKNARKKVFLCDNTKYGIVAPYKQCDIKDVDYLVCEDDADLRFRKFEGKIQVLK